MYKLKAKSLKRKVKVKNLKFLVLSFSFALYILRFALPCFAQDKIIAIVNSDVITQKDLDDFINFMRVQLSTEFQGQQLESKIQAIKSDLLEKLIEDSLILQEAKKNDSKIEIQPNVRISIKPDVNRVKAKLDEIKRRYGSDKEFQDSLSRQGLTQADIESRIRDQLLMYNMIEYKIRNKIVVNPGEVTDFYQKNIAEFKTQEQREFEALTIKEENLVKEIFNNLKNGQELQDLAKKYSLDVNKFSALKNSELRKDIEDVVFKLNLNEISGPVKIEGTYYIFKLDNIIPSRQQNLYEVQDKIYVFLFEKKMQEGLIKWLDELKKQSYIKVFAD